MLIIATAALTVGYLIRGIRSFIIPVFSGELKTLMVTTSFYLALTLIGMVFRHQWWPMPYWDTIFQMIWPVLTIGLAIQAVDAMRTPATKDPVIRKALIKNTLVPLAVIVLLALPTFLTSVQVFCKVYKPYSAEEMHERWEQEKGK